jgi:hypothetical protein
VVLRNNRKPERWKKRMVKLRKRIFLKAALITLIVFSVGFLFGYYLDSVRFGFIEDEMLKSSVASESFIVSQAYLQDHPDYCRLTELRLPQMARDVEQMGVDIGSFSEKSIFINYTILEQRYFIYEIRAWMSAEEYKTRCNKNITTILFFYKKNDTQSMNEGIVLTSIREDRNKYGKVMIFSFDKDFDEPSLALVREDFNVTLTPALIINKKKYEGFIGKDDLEKIILG